MNEPAQSIGRGRHGRREIPDKRYDAATKAAAMARFEAQAMPLAVAAELGIPYRTVWEWREKWLQQRMEVSSDADHGDEG